MADDYNTNLLSLVVGSFFSGVFLLILFLSFVYIDLVAMILSGLFLIFFVAGTSNVYYTKLKEY